MAGQATRLFDQLGAQINGTDAQRTSFLCWRVAPFNFFTAAWALGTLWTGYHPGLGVLQLQVLFWLAFFFGAVLVPLGMWGYYHPNPTRQSHVGFYNHFTLALHIFSTVLICFAVGPLNMLTGIAFISVPLIDLLLFPVFRTILYLSLGVFMLLGLNLLSMTGIMPYRPLVTLGTQPNLYINIMNTLVAAFFITYELTIVACLVRAWKRRESTVTQLSVTDPLTHTANRRRILELLETEINDPRNATCWLSVVMVDIDHFKLVNDTQGHQVGDEVLKTIANTLASCLRLYASILLTTR